MNTLRCSTIVIPALTRLQLASAIEQCAKPRRFSMPSAVRFLVLVAIAFMVLAFSAIARADDKTPAPHPYGQVQLCEVTAKGDLVCDKTDALEKTPRRNIYIPHDGKNSRKMPSE
jgi:hypothetical protein